MNVSKKKKKTSYNGNRLFFYPSFSRVGTEVRGTPYCFYSQNQRSRNVNEIESEKKEPPEQLTMSQHRLPLSTLNVTTTQV